MLQKQRTKQKTILKYCKYLKTT